MLILSAWGCIVPMLRLGEVRLGEAETVVALVTAVGGRSSEARDMAWAEVAGGLPVNSSRWIRDFRSSNSSHIMEGAAAAVDPVEDSVPSPAW